MSDVTLILSQIESGDGKALNRLLPLVYDELRQMAAARMSSERPDHTLQATALVHEAWLRLGDGPDLHFNSRSHFFAAAAEAMRRILVDHARAKLTDKRGGGEERAPIDFDKVASADSDRIHQTIAISDAIDGLATLDETSAQILKLRYFGGLSVTDAAEILGYSRADAYRHWRFAKAWLYQQLGDS